MYRGVPSAITAKPSPPVRCLHTTPSAAASAGSSYLPDGGPVVRMSSQSPSPVLSHGH